MLSSLSSSLVASSPLPADLLPRIVKPSHHHLTLGHSAELSRPTLQLSIEQLQPGGSFHCLNYVILQRNVTGDQIYSPGTVKFRKSVPSGISWFGRTKAPIASSLIVLPDVTDLSDADGGWGYEKSGREARMTLAKWVGTEMEGGEPMTSCTCKGQTSLLHEGELTTLHFPSGWSEGMYIGTLAISSVGARTHVKT